MKKLSLTLAALFCAGSLSAAPTEPVAIGDINYDTTCEVAGTPLKLNGAGLRKIVFFKVYAGGLYVSEPTTDATKVFSDEKARRVRLGLLRDVDGADFVEALEEGLNANLTPEKKAAIEKEVATLKTVMQTIDKLYPASRGYVNLNGEHYFTMEPQKSPTRLFLSGNISQSRDMIFFNFEYCQVEQEYPEDYFSILLEGYPLGDDRILNIISDSPRIFNITSDIVLPPKQNQSVMYSIDYIMNWGIVDGMICTMQEQKPRLFVCSWRQTDKQIDDDQLANYLLEWRILNNIK